jgi:hypothetical protein
MSTATVHVRYVNQPGEGKKLGTIKDVDGVVYGVAPEKLSLFQPGHQYSVEYSEREWQGRTFRTITAVSNGSGVSIPLPARRPPFRETSPVDAERMFVCGLLNAAVAAGKVEPISAASIIGCVQAARAAWRATFGNGV